MGMFTSRKKVAMIGRCLVNQPIKVIITKKSTSPIHHSSLSTHGLWVSRVIASQYKESRVYVSLNGYRSDNFLPYLYVSEDYGETWKADRQEPGLPDRQVLPNEPIKCNKGRSQK
jgi:hypothetical protein